VTVSTLVFVEHHEGEAQRNALGVLSKAARLGGDVAACVVGPGARAVAADLGRYGTRTAYAVEGEALAAPLPQPRVDVLAEVVGTSGAQNVFFAASVLASDVAAGLAARLDAGLNWGLVDVRDDGGRLVGVQAALGDTVYVDAGWSSTPRLALFRAGALEPVEVGGECEVVELAPAVAEWSRLATLVERMQATAEGPAIEEAEIIVAGGRGLGKPENFSLVEDLAKALGGAVAATRAVVDAGWYPYSTQVGQTGKSVAPKLYVACGISGAIQHKVGMQNAATIVAINKDRNAPIFDFCDLGVVGDLHDVLPRLTALVRERRGA
jgi:electron transfer flavoprotein alpha subunit